MQEQIFILNLLFCDYGYNIHGDNVFFNVNCVVLDCTKVTIGSNVFFAPSTNAPHSPTRYQPKQWQRVCPITMLIGAG
jgi:maltose O-acetyltransferase